MHHTSLIEFLPLQLHITLFVVLFYFRHRILYFPQPFHLQFRNVQPCFSASLILILTHLVCFHCLHLLHFTCPDFVFLSHMWHTSFLVVLFLGCVDLIFLSGNLFSTVIVNGIPVGPKKYELNHPNLMRTFALLIFIVRSLYEKPITFTKQTVFLFFRIPSF